MVGRAIDGAEPDQHPAMWITPPLRGRQGGHVQIKVAGALRARIGAELNRAGAEINRAGAEANRAGAEPNRIGAEVNRAGAEANRAGAEANRIAAPNADAVGRSSDPAGRPGDIPGQAYRPTRANNPAMDGRDRSEPKPHASRLEPTASTPEPADTPPAPASPRTSRMAGKIATLHALSANLAENAEERRPAAPPTPPPPPPISAEDAARLHALDARLGREADGRPAFLPEGLRCAGCGRDIGGLHVRPRCPHCQGPVIGSMAAWDVREMESAGAVRVRRDVALLEGVAWLGGGGALLAALAALLAGWEGKGDRAEMLGYALAIAAWVALASAIGYLVAFVVAHYTHRGPTARPGIAMRRGVIIGGAIMAAGFSLACVDWVLDGIIVVEGMRRGVDPRGRRVDVPWSVSVSAIVGVVLWLLGPLLIIGYGLSFAGQTLRRAGASDMRTWAEGAPVLLVFLVVALVPVWAEGRIPPVWLGAAASLGVAAGLGGLALRCGRAGNAIEGVMAEAA